MRLENFQALARLARMMPGSKAYQAAQMHLVDGISQKSACDELGIASSTVSQAVAKIHRAELDALRAIR